MDYRTTFRKRVCLDLLSAGPTLYSELKWRAWSREWASGRTKFVCANSASFNRGFKKSIESWVKQGAMEIADYNYPLTYGAAARLAVFTLLGRGQLSSPEPETMIRLYFHGALCSVIVSLDEKIAVNLGAIFTGNKHRYRILRLPNQTTAARAFNDVPWVIKLSHTGNVIDPATPLPEEEVPRWSSNFPAPESASGETRAPEGVALSLQHSTPGHILPYTITGENFTKRNNRFDC